MTAMMAISTTVIVWWYHNQGRRLPARACTALDLGTVWELDSKWAWWMEEGDDDDDSDDLGEGLLPWWWWRQAGCNNYLEVFCITLSQTFFLQYSFPDNSSQVFCNTLCQTSAVLQCLLREARDSRKEAAIVRFVFVECLHIGWSKLLSGLKPLQNNDNNNNQERSFQNPHSSGTSIRKD